MLAMKMDHLAYRVPDRHIAASIFERLGYTVEAEFQIVLEDGSAAESYALVNPHSPDIFVSSGPPGSKIQKWVDDHGGFGGVHHTAYAVYDVAATMAKWQEDGEEFLTEEPLRCSCDEPLTQVFTKPCLHTGIIYELINRNGHPGFCIENVRRLMSRSPG